MGHKGISRSTRATGLLLAVALLLAACSGSSSKSGSGGNGGSSDGGKPKMGGSVTMALEAETDTGWCLPEASLAASGIQVARAIYDYLTVPDENNNYVPVLASAITPSKNFTVWTIQVRPGITFHDGSKLDAKVVKDNIDAYTGKTDSKNLLFRFIMDADHWINDVKVTGPMTVEVDLKNPWVQFPSHLYSYGRMGIEAEAQLHSGSKCFKTMIGTGPFKFDGDWVVNDHLTVKRNPNYWRKDSDGNQLPYLDQITFRPVVDTNRLVNGLQTKQFDFALMDSADAVHDLTPLKNDGSMNWSQDTKFPEVTYAIFNTRKAPFNNINARKAYSFAVNSDEYNQLAQQGLQTKTAQPFGTGVTLAYLDPSKFPEGTIPPPTGDTEKARQFAQAYQQETGKALEFTYISVNDSLSLRNAQLLQSYMKKAGFTMNIKAEAQSKLVNDVIYPPNNYQVAGWRMHPGFDPDDQWVWWHCYATPAANTAPGEAAPTNIADPGPPSNGNNCDNLVNFGGFNDSVINKALETGRSSNDAATRTTAYNSLVSEFAKQFWNAWGWYTIWTVPYQTNLHNILGPNLPTATSPDTGGAKPFPGLSSGIDLSGLWQG